MGEVFEAFCNGWEFLCGRVGRVSVKACGYVDETCELRTDKMYIQCSLQKRALLANYSQRIFSCHDCFADLAKFHQHNFLTKQSRQTYFPSKMFRFFIILNFY